MHLKELKEIRDDLVDGPADFYVPTSSEEEEEEEEKKDEEDGSKPSGLKNFLSVPPRCPIKDVVSAVETRTEGTECPSPGDKPRKPPKRRK